MKKLFLSLFILCSAISLFAVPNVFNYQGKLTDPAGVGVNSVLDMTVRIYDAPTGGTLLDEYVAVNVDVVKGLFDLQYEVDLDMTALSGELYLELEIEGGYVMIPRVRIAAVPFALAAMYVDSAKHAINADSLGGYSALELMPNTLQGAYDEGGPGAGRRIDAISGPVDFRTAYVGPADGRALEIRTNDNIEAALYVYNAGTGPAIFCSGDFRLNGTIWSNADVKVQLDKNADPTNNKFFVVNDTGTTVFSVNEHGDAVILGELDPASVTFQPQAVAPLGVRGKVYYSNSDDQLKWYDGSAWREVGSGGGATGDYIENQNTVAQDGDFWIDGQGVFGGVTTYSERDVQIGSGTGTSYFRPLAGNWRYHREISYFTQAEIGAAGICTIDTISYYLGTVGTTDPWTFDSVFIWIDLVPSGTGIPSTWNPAGATQVFYADAVVVPQVLGWVHLDITDFDYDGTSDMRIYVQNGRQATNYGTTAPRFRESTVPSGFWSHGSSDSSWPTTLTTGTTRPNIRLSITGFPTVIDQVAIQNGNIDGDGDLNMGRDGTFGGDVSAASLTLDYTITAWPTSITKLDTIWANTLSDRNDTVRVLDNLFVNGELITDSIQARSDTIFLDDNIRVDGCGVFGGGALPGATLINEGFEGVAFPPTGWTQYSGTYDLGANTWVAYSSSYHSGTRSARIAYNFSAYEDEYLVSPMLNLSTFTNATLTFWDDILYPADAETSAVLVSTTGPTGPWTQVWMDNTDRNWLSMITVNLDAYAGEAQLWIAWHYTGENAHTWMIDDIVVFCASGSAPPEVIICRGDVTADGDIEAETFTLNGVTISDWPSGSGGVARFDTIWAGNLMLTNDTIYAMDNLFVHGELITDSIQAVGNIIDMDDSVNVIGAVSLGRDSTYRDDWEAQFVITVGANNADFKTLANALVAVAINGWPRVIIDIAPGVYILGTPPLTVPVGVHLRGSGVNITTLTGQITVNGTASALTFAGGAVVFSPGSKALNCSFEDAVTMTEVVATNCYFSHRTSPATFSGNSVVMGCIFTSPVLIDGICEFSDNVTKKNINVTGITASAHINGCKILNGGVIVNEDAKVYIESNYFGKDADEVGPAISVIMGDAEVKANHFNGRDYGAIYLAGGNLAALGNDIIACGMIEAAVRAFGSFNSATLLGNHIDGKGMIIMPGISIIGNESSSGKIKDNIVEGHGDGISVSSMHSGMRPMPIEGNLCTNNSNNGLSVATGNYLITKNTLFANNSAGGLFVDLQILPSNTIVSHNVVDTYSSVVMPVPGGLNTSSLGTVWVGAPQIGQLP